MHFGVDSIFRIKKGGGQIMQARHRATLTNQRGQNKLKIQARNQSGEGEARI